MKPQVSDFPAILMTEYLNNSQRALRVAILEKGLVKLLKRDCHKANAVLTAKLCFCPLSVRGCNMKFFGFLPEPRQMRSWFCVCPHFLSNLIPV